MAFAGPPSIPLMSAVFRSVLNGAISSAPFETGSYSGPEQDESMQTNTTTKKLLLKSTKKFLCAAKIAAAEKIQMIEYMIQLIYVVTCFMAGLQRPCGLVGFVEGTPEATE
jgi:hypothetical protein